MSSVFKMRRLTVGSQRFTRRLHLPRTTVRLRQPRSKAPQGRTEIDAVETRQIRQAILLRRPRCVCVGPGDDGRRHAQV